MSSQHRFAPAVSPSETIAFSSATIQGSENVANRLKYAVQTATEMGFEVRMVVLEDQSPGWCVIGARKLLFLDLKATTREQLEQLDAIIASYCNRVPGTTDDQLAA
ncbi:hypothetical protein SV7mr_46540 [Stieleria bergensis]|uniref:Uncharacterized protein n=1 Tax=Stieleria bergensis TaxID=2528025 RepID=A0A517T152_9BACT|nr:MAG: hypothetical protein CBB71_23150 [Rhodopirellula sp. TMED11]QDT62107.1 hypothetical protein SV7mr_46540 [Planctomycetes bacterium SV_7m_r]